MKAHRTDGLSLTFGLVFLAIVAWWLVAATVDLSLPNLGWFVAGALIVLGLLGLVGALRSGRDAAPVSAPVTAPPVSEPQPAADAPPVVEPWPTADPWPPARAEPRPADERVDVPVDGPEPTASDEPADEDRTANDDRTETDLFDSRGKGETGPA